MADLLARALAARRQSRRVVFRTAADDDWRETVRDVVAFANSGGGVILLEHAPGRAAIASHIHELTGSDFANFDVVDAVKEGKAIVAVIVGETDAPIVFTGGTIYFRHGSKSEPATSKDLEKASERKLKAVRKSFLNAVRRVVEEPSDATPVRIVDDPHAQAVRVIDYDKTHPYRQKELLAALRSALPAGRPLNQFDLRVVRHLHGIDDIPAFSHKTLYGTRQYSRKFLDWLIAQGTRDPQFFDEARRKFAEPAS